MHRRDFLTAAAATAAFSRPSLATPIQGPKAVIVLALVGGPSQIDTFDPKPAAPSHVRSPFRPIATRVPGLFVTELFPRLAAVADRVAFVRAVRRTTPPVHEAGLRTLFAGHAGRTGSVHVGGRPDTGIPLDYSLPPSAPAGDFVARCDAAASAVEAGTRFVTVSMCDTVFDAPSWDCHADGGALSCDLGDYRDSVAPAFDLGFTRLLARLARTGRLAETLVIAAGEFGRSPLRNSNGGRDHWPHCWTALLAGCGVRGGEVIGESDAHAAEPKDAAVSLEALLAPATAAAG